MPEKEPLMTLRGRLVTFKWERLELSPQNTGEGGGKNDHLLRREVVTELFFACFPTF